MVLTTLKRFTPYFDRSLVWIIFLFSLWIVGIKMFGSHFQLIPGDFGDARFNNYILEHFFRWLSGLEHSFWTAPFFYPFPKTITFSDNLLGSVPFYIPFRWIGLDRESAFQAWYAIGILLNYVSAAYALSRFNLKPLAVSAGAFFFTFGLPFLAQENHAQLVYRFCIPLACFWLWKLTQEPRLELLAALILGVVWQFFLGIYLGVFLSMLIAVMIVLLPLYSRPQSLWEALFFWPRKLRQAWLCSSIPMRIILTLTMLGLVSSLTILFLQYYSATKIYGFWRSWDAIVLALPKWQSYFISDRAWLWQTISRTFTDLPARVEHQLFPGLAVYGIISMGLLWRSKANVRPIAWLNLFTACILFIVTFSFQGFSLYRVIAGLPGVNSIRAVTRIELVLMWPLALFIAFVLDSLIRFSNQGSRLIKIPVLLFVSLLFCETIFYQHITYDKVEAQARLANIRAQIPETVPDEPILFLAAKPTDPLWIIETDAMLLAQNLGWPTINGYSGNNPPGYQPPYNCSLAEKRIADYIEFAHPPEESVHSDFIRRIVPIGFNDCMPAVRDH